MGPLAMTFDTNLPLDADPDAELVAGALGGDQAAFAELVRRYQDRLFGLVRGYTRSAAEIEDIVQETFLKAYSKLDSYRAESSFSTWLCRIAVNTALDQLKRRGRSPVVDGSGSEWSLEEPSEATPGPPPPDARLERAELRAITEAVLDTLPEPFRSVLVLREFEELSYLEIAELLDISIGTVESRLFRARARFKEALAQAQPELFRDLSGPGPDAPRKRRRLGGSGPAAGGAGRE
jgi:RNA polymerase sigma-70 factor (ECF subfamily)